VIPIRDGQGHAVGFGSRKLPAKDGEEPAGDSESPKYLNTPQTPIFDKGAILFGLDRAAESIRRADVAVIVEGYMDVIAAHQHGNGNVVASMGTALTERQLGLLRRLTENIVLAFDPDEAGSTARERGGQKGILAAASDEDGSSGWIAISRFRREHGTTIRKIARSHGDTRDPDEIIRSDPDEWRRLVKEAQPLPTDSIMDSVLQPISARRKHRPTLSPGSDVEKVDASRAEEVCLALLIRYPQLRGQGLTLDEELFVRTENRQVFAAWRASEPQRPLAESLAEELRPHLEQIESRNLPPFDPAQAEKALQTCAEHLKRSKIKVERAFISLEIAEKEQRLGARHLLEHARKLMEGEAPSQDLPEDETADARIVVRDMEAGLELHERKT
jgi:DNA primase